MTWDSIQSEAIELVLETICSAAAEKVVFEAEVLLHVGTKSVDWTKVRNERNCLPCNPAIQEAVTWRVDFAWEGKKCQEDRLVQWYVLR